MTHDEMPPSEPQHVAASVDPEPSSKLAELTPLGGQGGRLQLERPSMRVLAFVMAGNVLSVTPLA